MTPAQYKYLKRAVEIEDMSNASYSGIMWGLRDPGNAHSGCACFNRNWIRQWPSGMFTTSHAGRRALAEYEKQGGEA